MNKTYYLVSSVLKESNPNDIQKDLDVNKNAKVGKKIGKNISRIIKILTTAAGKKPPKSLKILQVA